MYFVFCRANITSVKRGSHVLVNFVVVPVLLKHCYLFLKHCGILDSICNSMAAPYQLGANLTQQRTRDRRAVYSLLPWVSLGLYREMG
jgi:hypothetical protein